LTEKPPVFWLLHQLSNLSGKKMALIVFGQKPFSDLDKFG